MGRPPFLGGGRNFENVTVWGGAEEEKIAQLSNGGLEKKKWLGLVV